MSPISTSSELRAAIADLEKKKEIQQLTIKGQIAQTKQALNPVHLVKNTFSRLAGDSEIRKTLISTIIGIGIGYISKKAVDILKEDNLDRMVNNFVDRGIHTIVQKNPNSFLSKAVSITRQIAKESR